MAIGAGVISAAALTYYGLHWMFQSDKQRKREARRRARKGLPAKLTIAEVTANRRKAAGIIFKPRQPTDEELFGDLQTGIARMQVRRDGADDALTIGACLRQLFLASDRWM